jgi:hypothetical protein
MAIQISGTTVIDNGRNVNAGVGTFTNLNVPPQVLSFSPSDGATGVSINPNISITFNQPIQRGSGNITLRSGSASGTVLITIPVSLVTVSGSVATITVGNLPTSTNVFVVIPAGAFTSSSFSSPNALIDTYDFTTLNFTLNSITPANSSTGISRSTNITLAFTSPPSRGTGTITLRSGSSTGTILESFDAASSGRISISGNNWILDPSSNIAYSTNVWLVIPSTAIANYAGLNVAGASSHNFTTEPAPVLGSSFEGGNLICTASAVHWIVAPLSAQVVRTWANRAEGNTRAQEVSGCTGWFVPTCAQLQNPGYVCRTYWDSYPSAGGHVWSNTERNSTDAYYLNVPDGAICSHGKAPNDQVRSFRCVTY